MAFFVLCYNQFIESARYSTEPSASDWDISKSLINHLLMRQEKNVFKYPRLISWVFFTLGEHLVSLRKQNRKIDTCEFIFYDSGEKINPSKSKSIKRSHSGGEHPSRVASFVQHLCNTVKISMFY